MVAPQATSEAESADPRDTAETALRTEQEQVRRDKRARMQAEGNDPYAFGFPRTTDVVSLRARFSDLAPDTFTGEVAGVAGRVVLNRVSGKIIFATLRDVAADLQVMLTLDASGQDLLDRWKNDVDLGDHVGVTGEVITSKRGELSLLASDFQITSKCLHPLPEKHAGLTDPEARVRQRYVDLIVRQEARDMVYLRSGVVRSLRETLHGERLHRGRDTHAAGDARGRERAALRHPHQCVRHAPLPAHRSRAVPQAAAGRRRRSGLRDQPQLPQRRCRLVAQP